MMTIIIHTEGARRAVLYALWGHAGREIGERFYDRLADEADAMLAAATGGHPAVIGEEIGLLLSTLSSVDRVRAADVGSHVQIDVTPAELAEGLSRCAESVSEDRSFWAASASDRERAIATYDGARTLLAKLGQEAAVA